MRKIREVLRLSHGEGLSHRQVARVTGVGPTTVREYLSRAAAAGLSWPLPDDVDDADLERRLFARGEFPLPTQRPTPDWATVHRELRRPSVTLQLLWMLCRHRHNIHYADRVVMPTRPSPGVWTSSPELVKGFETPRAGIY